MVHNAFGLSGPALLPLFEEYMRETCSELVKPKRAWSDRQWGTSSVQVRSAMFITISRYLPLG